MQASQLFGKILGSTTSSASRLGESLATSGTPYARYTPGPCSGGRFSYQSISSGTFTATMTVWYSSLPDPDPDVIGDWWQDTSVGSSGTITLTAGTAGGSVGNIAAPWVMYRVTVASGTLELSLWHASEGTH